jgi:CHC2-type zinc finger protein
VQSEKPSIVDTIGQYLPLRRSGKEFTACCPFHEDKHPSFSVNEEAGVFYCFGCGATGDVIDFLKKWSGKSYKEICDHLGLHGSAQPIVPDETRIAARKIREWSIRLSLKIAERMIDVGQRTQLARDMMSESRFDPELLKWKLNELFREWTILEILHEDLVDPEELLSLYEQREDLERLVENGCENF